MRRGFVRQARQADDERHLSQRASEVGLARHRKDRVHVVDDGELDITGAHRVAQRLHIRVGGGVQGRGSAEVHRSSDIAGDVVEQGDRGRRRGGVRAGDADPTPYRQAAPGTASWIRELAGQVSNPVGRQAGC